MAVRKSVRDPRIVEHFEEVLVWLRMGDEDRERYGGPEWVAFDVADLFNAPASQLEAYEREIQFPMYLLLHEFMDYGARATRAALFIARRRAGVENETWSEFDPRTMHVKRRDRRPDEPDAAGSAAVNGSRSGRGKSRRGGSASSPDGLADAASPTSSTSSAPD